MSMHKIIASFFWMGYIGRGSGTAAAFVAAVLWYFSDLGMYLFAGLALSLLIILVGVWSSFRVESAWGHDSNRIVIDEVAGMLISLIGIPVNWIYVLIAFVLFRFFDIVKPLFIKRTEKLNGGWGVMMDDVLAGIYANVIVQAIVFFKLI